MDFTYTETQDMIRDTLARFLSDTYDFETRQKFVNSDGGRDPAIWTALARELGMLGAPFAEEHGGLGGGALENARSEEHTSELQSLMRISEAVFRFENKKKRHTTH